MVALIIIFCPVILFGAIIARTIALGVSIDFMPGRAPTVVRREERPREFWTSIYVAIVVFAGVIFGAVNFLR